jgi:hypothetical protein
MRVEKGNYYINGEFFDYAVFDDKDNLIFMTINKEIAELVKENIESEWWKGDENG